ncbi:MAG: hypothetical protein R6X08_00525 [Desulfosalsimonadaceae bacterium]
MVRKLGVFFLLLCLGLAAPALAAAANTMVAAGRYHTVGLQSDGSVIAAGSNNFNQCDVSFWSDIRQITAGDHHTVGLQSDGTLIATGDKSQDQCDVNC